MIRKVSVNNIGSLVHFVNTGNEFPDKNCVIHGLNGSGKSQLCSVLRMISRLRSASQSTGAKRERIEDDVAAYLTSRQSKEAQTKEIQVGIDDYNLIFNVETGKIIQTGNHPVLFVFNEAYIEENVGDDVDLPMRKIKIGEKNKERDTLLEKIKEGLKVEKTLNKAISDLVIKTKKDSGYKNQTRTSRLISIENYLSSVNPGENNPEAKAKLDNLTVPPEMIDTHLSMLFPKFQADQEEKNKIEKVFTKPYIEPKLTAQFYRDYMNTSKSFYETGVSLFATNGQVCPFCLTPKKTDDPAISELISYVDSEYSAAKTAVKDYIARLEDTRNRTIEFIAKWNSHAKSINDKAEMLLLEDRFMGLSFNEDKYKKCINIIKKKYDNMALLVAELEIEDSVYADAEFAFTEIREEFEKQQNLIERINESIKRIRTTKQNLGEKIIKHHMYLLWNKSGMRDRLGVIKAERKKNEERFSELAGTISNDRTIDFFNQIVQILGIHKYRLNDESFLILKLDNDYNISKEGFRISTGERKFIALSYFFAEVLASVNNSTELKNVTVVIDDPVDSSDYNKFYSFISVIERYDHILRKIYSNDTIMLGQMIIFTHNALLYERFVNGSMEQYMLLNEENCTKISKPNKKVGLATFSSYIRKVTNHIKNMERSNDKDIGNYIRRILEIVASIENIESNKIRNLNASSKLNALSNHLSHESIERLLDPLPETHEYICACIELIEEIRNRVPALYQSIKLKYLDERDIEDYRTQYEQLFLTA